MRPRKRVFRPELWSVNPDRKVRKSPGWAQTLGTIDAVSFPIAQLDPNLWRGRPSAPERSWISE